MTRFRSMSLAAAGLLLTSAALDCQRARTESR
jgi:hypothetical protein